MLALEGMLEGISVKYQLLPQVSPYFLFRSIATFLQKLHRREDCQVETGKFATEQILTFSPKLKFYKEKQSGCKTW